MGIDIKTKKIRVRLTNSKIMPVCQLSIKTAIKKIAPIFTGYAIILLVISVISFYCNLEPFGIPLIYISSFILGAWLMLLNEEKLVPVLMINEIEHYFTSIITLNGPNNEKPDEKIHLNLVTYPLEFLQVQYDYFIKKTLLSQRLSSMYLFTLLGGIVIDISLNSLSSQNIIRTFLLINSVAFFSTLFFTICILKHAEYNAGCAIYRFAILSLNILQRNFADDEIVSKGEVWTLLGRTFELMRNKNCGYNNSGQIIISTTNSADAIRNVNLLQLFGLIKKVP